MAGVCEYTVCQPVDMVATRRMLLTGSSTNKRSMIHDIMGVYQEGGLGGLYRGLGPQLLAAVPATCGMYAGERFFAHLFEKEDGSTNLPRTFAAGFCSGVTETASVCPFEVLKVRLQSKEYMGRYKNTLHCLQTVVREEGVATLYAGFVAHAYRNCIFNSTFFAGCYLLREHVFARTNDWMQAFAIDLFCGTVMGAAATPAKMPFFVVKTRKQATSGSSAKQYPKGTLSTMAIIAKEVSVRHTPSPRSLHLSPPSLSSTCRLTLAHLHLMQASANGRLFLARAAPHTMCNILSWWRCLTLAC